MLRIAAYAKVLARLRGTISVWREGAGDDETYNFTSPVIEKPHRAMSLLYALARGHALVHGRDQLTEEDLPLVARAALESTPNDRRAVIRLLLAHDGIVSTSDVQAALRCSAPTARAILETLDKLGIGAFANPGPPEPATLTLSEPLRWLLEPAPVIETKATPSAGGIETNLTPSTNGADELEVERLAELARDMLKRKTLG
jgi:AAA lid domain